MPDSVWFYSLSTIAQVMATIAGLFAVFAVFRLDKLNRNISEFREMIIKSVKKENGAPMIDGHSGFEMTDRELVKKAKEYLLSSRFRSGSISFGTDYGDMLFGEKTIGLFQKLIKKNSDILCRLKISLALSLSCVSASVLLLVWSNEAFIYSDVLLPVVVLVSVVTLCYIGFSSYKLNIS